MNSKRKYVEANKILGDKYKIVIIDLCWCLYKDFGNGYDVEINIEGTLKNIKEIQVFLWKQQPYQIVKTYYCDKIEEINDIVDKFYKDTQKYSIPISSDELAKEHEDGLNQQEEYFRKKYPKLVFA